MNSGPRLKLHVDERGVTRQLVDLWLPHVDADVVWVVGAPIPDEELERDAVPFVSLSAVDAATVCAEVSDDTPRALVVFASLDALHTAALMGLPPERVTLLHIASDESSTRLAADIHVSESQIALLAALEDLGFSFEIRPLPNVTARPWSATAAR